MDFIHAAQAVRIVNCLEFIFFRIEEAISKQEKIFAFYWNDYYGMSIDYCLSVFKRVRNELEYRGYVVEFHRQINIEDKKLLGWEVRISFDENDIAAGHLTTFVYPEWFWSNKQKRFVKYYEDAFSFYNNFDKQFTMIDYD